MENITSILTDKQRAEDGAFAAAMLRFYRKYCDEEARDTMCKYLRSQACHKPRNTTPGDHAERLETLIRYTNKLPGNEPLLTNEQTKDIIFTSFPDKWQQHYGKLRRKIAEDSLEDIVGFMKDEKHFADEEDKKGPRKIKEEKTDNSRKEHRKKRSHEGELCRKHNGGHLWVDCPDNRNNRHSRAFRGRGFDRNGRGRGGTYGRKGFPPNQYRRSLGRGHGDSQDGRRYPPNNTSTAGNSNTQSHYGSYHAALGAPLPPATPSYHEQYHNGNEDDRQGRVDSENVTWRQH